MTDHLDEEVEHLRERLRIHRRTLMILEEQIAQFTEMEAPVHKLSQRDQVRAEIQRLEAQLQALSSQGGRQASRASKEKPPRKTDSTGRNQRQQRCDSLGELIRDAQALLKEYEELRLLADDPKEKLRLERQIADLKAQMKDYEAEYQELQCHELEGR